MRSIFFVIILSLCVQAQAQQDPVYALYLNNPVMINPAYAGLTPNTIFYAGRRQQWIGLDGAPVTTTAGLHTSLRENKLGIGFSVLQDVIGENNNTQITTQVAYKIELTDATLAFGMQVGMMQYRAESGALNIFDMNDYLFEPINETQFTAGAGIMVKSEKYLLGISVPRLINQSMQVSGEYVRLYDQHYYAFGSHLIFIRPNINLKPSVLVRYIANAPLSYDLNMTMMWNQKISAGLFTRNFNSAGLLGQLILQEKLTVSYVAEIPVRGLQTSFTSHEIMLTLRTSLLPYHDRTLSNY